MFLKPKSFMEMKNTPKFSLLLTLSFIAELVETAKQYIRQTGCNFFILFFLVCFSFPAAHL